MEHLISFDALSVTLNYIRSHTKTIYVCSDAPLDYGQISSYMLARTAIGSGDFRGPEEFTGAPDAEEGSGPEAILYVLQVSGMVALVNGFSKYVVLAGDSELLVVVPTDELELVVCEEPVNIHEWCIRVRQPLQSCE